MRDDKAKRGNMAWTQIWLVATGVLGFIFAHLFSLNHVRELFGKQLNMGKVPGREAPAPAPANA